MKALEKDRNRRYETANGLGRGRAALPGRRGGAGVPAVGGVPLPQVRPAEHAARWSTAAVVGLALLLAVAGAGRGYVLDRAGQLGAESSGRAAAARRHAQARAAWRRTSTGLPWPTGNCRSTTWPRPCELLDECPEDLREWEWRYLKRLCRVEPLIIRDTTEVNGVAFSPDGERLASAGGDGIVKIWNSRTGKVIRLFPRTRRGRQRRVPPRRQAPGLRRRGRTGEGLGLDGDRQKVFDRAVRRHTQVRCGVHRGVQSRRPATRGGQLTGR